MIPALSTATLIALLCAITLMAVLYSSVGHGGASGYLAAMALFSVSPEFMRPTALLMNIFVAGLVAWRLGRAGHFNLQLFWPLALTSIPCAYLGGTITLNDSSYRVIVGIALLLASARILFGGGRPGHTLRQAPRQGLLLSGALLGLIAGLTGVGGGIYLSPLLLLFGWCTMRSNAAIVAVFILVNSSAGLAGFVLSGNALPDNTVPFIAAALLGALLGAELATRRLGQEKLRKVLGVVLVIAGFKMMLLH